jgi:hypothetical protein
MVRGRTRLVGVRIQPIDHGISVSVDVRTAMVLRRSRDQWAAIVVRIGRLFRPASRGLVLKAIVGWQL